MENTVDIILARLRREKASAINARLKRQADAQALRKSEVVKIRTGRGLSTALIAAENFTSPHSIATLAGKMERSKSPALRAEAADFLLRLAMGPTPLPTPAPKPAKLPTAAPMKDRIRAR